METEPTNPPQSNRRWFWVAGIVVVIVVGLLIWFLVTRKPNAAPSQTTSTTNTNPTWQEKGVAVAGQYADADAVDLGNGTYRLYYAVEPEVPGNKMEIFSATSSDGISWTKESGNRKEFAAFPDVLKLPDGRWRMYFQSNKDGGIKSAISTDGLQFTDEPGLRIDTKEPGYTLRDVGAQSTTILADGSYLMIYHGTIDEPYQTSEKLPNSTTQIYFWATSTDGLTFTRKGLAIDSRDNTLLGLADGADFVRWDDGELRVYFWSYTGIYHSVYADGTFSAPVFDFTNNPDPKLKFAPNPPGDPTVIKINSHWQMYYGQHTKGIYYATIQ